jgi:hypothetical protein
VVSQARFTDGQVSPHDQDRQAETESNGHQVTAILAVSGNSGEVSARNPSRIDPERTQPIKPAISGAATALQHLSGEVMRVLGTADILSCHQIADPPVSATRRDITALVESLNTAHVARGPLCPPT